MDIWNLMKLYGDINNEVFEVPTHKKSYSDYGVIHKPYIPTVINTVTCGDEIKLPKVIPNYIKNWNNKLQAKLLRAVENLYSHKVNSHRWKYWNKCANKLWEKIKDV